jgi:hypothetical protein
MNAWKRPSGVALTVGMPRAGRTWADGDPIDDDSFAPTVSPDGNRSTGIETGSATRGLGASSLYVLFTLSDLAARASARGTSSETSEPLDQAYGLHRHAERKDQQRQGAAVVLHPDHFDAHAGSRRIGARTGKEDA